MTLPNITSTKVSIAARSYVDQTPKITSIASNNDDVMNLDGNIHNINKKKKSKKEHRASQQAAKINVNELHKSHSKQRATQYPLTHHRTFKH